MLKIHQVKCPVGKQLDEIQIARKLRCRPEDIQSFQIERESLDARKEELQYAYTVYVEVKNENKYLKQKDVVSGKPEVYQMPSAPKNMTDRPVVVGFGPAGMFAALLLAEAGCRPIVIERGKNVDARTKDVNRFFTDGTLLEESNVQFGEGGAGTFSDGKLTTRMKNIRVSKVLDELVEAGGNPAIRYQQRPHIGTDVLRVVVKNIREKILSLGGEIYFETKLESLMIENHVVTGLRTNRGEIYSGHVLLCAGHSASDTYEVLYGQGIKMIQKDFAAGVRVEHPQTLINENQYGKYANHPSLGAASYQLTYHASTNRGVYSFCMCPGGQVVPASTKQGTLAVNGMSYAARDLPNANSAILVQIPTSDFDHGHPLDGFAYQAQLEKRAYRKHYHAPSQNINDFIHNTQSKTLVLDSSYPLGTEIEDMHGLFSTEVNQSLTEAFQAFDHKIPGFQQQGIMVGMESRSSSPIRIPRDEKGESLSLGGFYPCGEGAGYAGGIISSAVDGISQAEKVIASYQE